MHARNGIPSADEMPRSWATVSDAKVLVMGRNARVQLAASTSDSAAEVVEYFQKQHYAATNLGATPIMSGLGRNLRMTQELFNSPEGVRLMREWNTEQLRHINSWKRREQVERRRQRQAVRRLFFAHERRLANEVNAKEAATNAEAQAEAERPWNV